MQIALVRDSVGYSAFTTNLESEEAVQQWLDDGTAGNREVEVVEVLTFNHLTADVVDRLCDLDDFEGGFRDIICRLVEAVAKAKDSESKPPSKVR